MKTSIHSISITVTIPADHEVSCHGDLYDNIEKVFETFEVERLLANYYLVTIQYPYFALHTIQGRVAAIFSRHIQEVE